MKPFDLKAALAGEPVILRGGRKAFVLCDLKQYFKNPKESRHLIGIISMETDPNSFEHSLRWYDCGAYYVATEDEYDIIGMWEEPELTTEELMEKAFQEKLVIIHNVLPSNCRGFKVVGKTLDDEYILLDCDDNSMQFLHVFNENIKWTIKN